MGGWLALFVAIMAFFSPLSLVAGTASALYGDPAIRSAYPDSVFGAIEIGEWTLVTGGVLGCWFVAYRLMKVQVWRSVQLTVAGIWILGLGLTVCDLILVSVVAGIDIVELAAASTRELGRPLVFGTVWTAYFLRSRRVANTYPRGDGEQDASVFA